MKGIMGGICLVYNRYMCDNKKILKLLEKLYRKEGIYLLDRC